MGRRFEEVELIPDPVPDPVPDAVPDAIPDWNLLRQRQRRVAVGKSLDRYPGGLQHRKVKIRH